MCNPPSCLVAPMRTLPHSKASPQRNAERLMQTRSTTYCTPEELEPDRDELATLRHTIHQHPELSHKEVETARLVAERLRSYGYDVTEGVGGTGVVGQLKVGSGARKIG